MAKTRTIHQKDALSIMVKSQDPGITTKRQLLGCFESAFLRLEITAEKQEGEEEKERAAKRNQVRQQA